MKHSNSFTPSTLVISVGGSLVVPTGGIDTAFLTSFKSLIKRQVNKGWRFVIVVGGGWTARQYQQAARAIGKLELDDIDWLGIHSTRLNGHLMRTVLRDIAHPVMIKNPTAPLTHWREPVLVAAGWKPGWSTDYVATRLAIRLGADVVVNLSNVDYVYDKDPRTHTDAKAICHISWEAFREMVGDTWDPGMNAPFDPVASRLAHRREMTVALLNGKNMKNLAAFFGGRRFIGTVIRHS
ncbi:UMP kinase [Candidatus Parcubacteria bacterium]|nr:UMP kinase [Candidatus Parcubacteria bacterium]